MIKDFKSGSEINQCCLFKNNEVLEQWCVLIDGYGFRFGAIVLLITKEMKE
jgi:hypothetical protein